MQSTPTMKATTTIASASKRKSHISVRSALSVASLAIVLAGCASDSTAPSPKYSGEKVLLPNGFECGASVVQKDMRKGETHRCYFALGGLGAERFVTAEARADRARFELQALCKDVRVLADEPAKDSAYHSPDMPQMQRVSLKCVN